MLVKHFPSASVNSQGETSLHTEKNPKVKTWYEEDVHDVGKRRGAPSRLNILKLPWTLDRLTAECLFRNVEVGTGVFVIHKIFVWADYHSLGTFAKYEKRLLAESFPSVRPFVCTHETTRLPLDGFLWSFIFEYFSEICQRIQVSSKSDKNDGYFTWRPTYIFDHIPPSSS
jgi:hypothetical protein